MIEELYNKIDKFCNETDWSKYLTYEHALEEFIKGIVAEETKELEAQIEKLKSVVISERDEALRVEDVITYSVLNDIIDKLEIKEK